MEEVDKQNTKPTEHSGLRKEFGYIVLRIISRPVGRLGLVTKYSQK